VTKKIQNWLVIGVVKNWETALSQPVPIWGLKPRYMGDFQALNIGDMVWFYATSPIKGVIGVGMVRDKYIDDMNLVWEKELLKKEVIWPLRFRIHVLKVISKNQWKTDNIKIKDFHLNWQIGFQYLQDENVAMLMSRAKTAFGFIGQENFFTGATITQPITAREIPSTYAPITEEQKPSINHRDIQEMIAEIGKLQFYHTQLEYPIELQGEEKNIDVVWKREIAGVPTIAFEVELSGMVERAIARLKFAFMRWNSRSRIIVPKKVVKKVNNVIAAEDRVFSRQFKMYQPNQIVDILTKKRNLKSLEQNLELY